MNKKYFFIINMIFVAIFTLVACEECEECTNDVQYISSYTELEAMSCDILAGCAGAYMSESKCKANDYPESCHECILEADTCSAVDSCYASKCAGKEDSFNNDTSNNTTTTDYDDLCDIVRIDCGYDNLSHADCVADLMPELGSTGRNCIDDADNCLEVSDCLDEYAY